MKRALALVFVLIFTFSFFVVSADNYGIMPRFQTSISEIEEHIKGGSKYLSDAEFGKITREKIVAELTDHQNDGYYIGTPYHRSDWQSPNGDTSYNGRASMNCCGFVCYVLRKCGMDAEKIISLVKKAPYYAPETGNLPYDLISKASNYYELIKEAELKAYAFATKNEMLNSGKCAKGDIILMYVNSPLGLDYGEDNHIGFFWGENSSDDKFWHSTTKNARGNDITKITESTAVYLLIKIDESDISINPEAEFTTYITKSEVNLRSAAGTDASIISKLPADTEVKLIEKLSLKWYKVEVNGAVGYISAPYLVPLIKDAEPEDPVPPEEVTPPAEIIPPEGILPPEEEDDYIDLSSGSVPMYRLYNPNSGEHFYTGSKKERSVLVYAGWSYEGVGFNFPTKGSPVYRLYEPVSGEHLYTMDNAEKTKLLNEGWNYEGVAFNSASTDDVPQYRLHNPNASCGAYHFTGSPDERDILISEGWEYQGIGFYSLEK